MASGWLRRKTRNGFVRLHRALSPSERAFREVFREVETIEGFLRSPMQERWLFKAARSLPAGASVVEVGSFKGRSTGCLGAGVKSRGGHVWAIDRFEGDGGAYGDNRFLKEFQANMDRLGLGEVVSPVQADSRAAARDWDRSIHLLFLDGSHEYDDVTADFEAFFPFVVDGGLVAFHDVGPEEPGVLRMWREVAGPRLTSHGQCSSLAYGRKAGAASGFRPFLEEALYRGRRARDSGGLA